MISVKEYLQKALKDTFLIWLLLEIGIIISAVLYALLKVGGVSSNTSLVVAFVILVGLIVLGFAFSSTDTSGLRQLLRRWLSGEQKLSQQLESLVVRQNFLLEKLNQNLKSLTASLAVGSAPDLASKQSQSPEGLTFQLSGDSLAKLDDLVEAIDSNIHESMTEQREIIAQLAQNQRREQDVIEQLGQNMASQQESLAQVVQSLTTQQRVLEQLVQQLEQWNANREESREKVAILSPEGRAISNVETSQTQVFTGSTPTGVIPGRRIIGESPPGYLWVPDTKPSTEPEQTGQQGGSISHESQGKAR
jgi:hypothetical protein